ncbi:N-acetylglucosamine-6-phosphate deacetylase [Parapedobacter sp. ISTM3]|nr:N-acetylglucosamine-6-phosphate deacetylase [Parapedobacter sp. ISTM3]MBK1440886.1 N-acetylglucosamine-6-phosphate deacetylase [Parapedobacter sp. ISTM3]
MGKAYKKIINGRIITPNRVIVDGQLLLSEGKIVEVSDGNIDAPNSEIIDAKGSYVAPGFIDMHVHGGGGADFMDGSIDAFLTAAKTHVRYGTTALLPTILTSTKEQIIQSLALYEQAAARAIQGSRFLGVHIEGPYFAMKQRGAQDPRYIRDPDPAEYMEILASSSSIKRWSIAPERAGAIAFGRMLRERNILPSIAHTDALYADVLKAFDNGYTLVTHLYSAMSGVTRRNAYRYGGVIESAYLLDDMDVEIIADGKHLPPELLQLVYKIKGADRTALITDAMRAAAMPEGPSVLGNIADGMAVLVEDGVAKLPDRTAFAGSIATADRLVRTMVAGAGIPLVEAVRMITATPARILGVDHHVGVLANGKDADVVLFNDDIEIRLTLVNGDIVYKHET